MRRLSHILGPLLFLAYIVLWTGGVFMAVCIGFPPIVRWGAVVAVAAPPIFAWWLFHRAHLPEGWYRPSRILVILVAVTCFLVTWPAILSGGQREFNVMYCGLGGRHVFFSILFPPVRNASDDDSVKTQPPPFWPETNTWLNSNAYFAEVIRLRASDPMPLYPSCLISQTSLRPASSPEALEKGGGCAWACLAGIGECDSDDTPFLWTANLRVGPEDFGGADPMHPKRWANRVDRRRLHGLGPWVIVIRKDGRKAQAPAWAVTDAWFLGASSNATARIETLYPILFQNNK